MSSVEAGQRNPPARVGGMRRRNRKALSRVRHRRALMSTANAGPGSAPLDVGRIKPDSRLSGGGCQTLNCQGCEAPRRELFQACLQGSGRCPALDRPQRGGEKPLLLEAVKRTFQSASQADHQPSRMGVGVRRSGLSEVSDEERPRGFARPRGDIRLIVFIDTGVFDLVQMHSRSAHEDVTLANKAGTPGFPPESRDQVACSSIGSQLTGLEANLLVRAERIRLGHGDMVP